MDGQSVLSTLLAGDKEAVIYFIALFGYYPILKGAFEFKIKNRAVQYILKFAVFNVAAIGSFFAATWLLSIPTDEFTVFGFYVPWALPEIFSFCSMIMQLPYLLCSMFAD